MTSRIFRGMSVLLLSVLGSCTSAQAAPAISGSSGTWGHGNAVTVSGSAFGSSVNAIPVIFDQGQYATFAASPWSGKAPMSLGAPYDTEYSTGVGGVAMPHSKVTRYMTGVHLDFSNPSNGVDFYKTRTAPGGYPFYSQLSYYTRVAPNWTFQNGSPNDGNFKEYLFSAGPEPFGGCTFYTSSGGMTGPTASRGQHGYADEVSPPSPFGCGASNSFLWPDNNGDGPFHYCWDTACEANPASSWIKQEFMARWDNNASTGWFDQIYNGGVARNVQARTHSYEGPTAVLAGGVTGGVVTDSGGGYARDRSANNRRYFTDIYLSYGLQRVVLGNAATYAASNVREYQKPTAWSATSVTLNVNTATFADGATAYIYVCDDQGVCNTNGTPITIAASGGGDSTAPTTPGTPTCAATSSTSINVTWTASTDVSGIANYRLERCALDGCSPVTEVATPGTNSYTDTVPNPTIYRYRVRAVDASVAANNSAYSGVGMCAAPATPTPFAYGLNSSIEVRNNYTAPERELFWTAAANAGAQFMRQDITHSGVEGTQNTFVWTVFDTMMTEIIAHGMTPLALLNSNPGWNQTASHQNAPPLVLSEWVDFVTAAVTRYSAPPYNIRHWEVLNEVNLQPGPWTVAQYVASLQATYNAIKAVSPTSVVMLNLAPFGTNADAKSATQWLTGIYANGGQPYFDAVSFHPYAWEYDPTTVANWNTMRQLTGETPSLRSIMVANGDSYKPIWITEFGGTTTGGARAISDSLQASRIIVQQYDMLASYSFVGPAFVHNLRDRCTNTADIECGFGLLRDDWTRKPAYGQYKKRANPLAKPTGLYGAPR